MAGADPWRWSGAVSTPVGCGASIIICELKPATHYLDNCARTCPALDPDQERSFSTGISYYLKGRHVHASASIYETCLRALAGFRWGSAMNQHHQRIIAALLLMTSVGSAFGQDAANGEDVFKKCRTCRGPGDEAPSIQQAAGLGPTR